MSERWIPVVGFEDFYSVSDEGRVRSEDRRITQVNRHGEYERVMKGRILKPSVDKRSGYALVGLSRGGVYGSRRVHQLVLEAFVGPQPTGVVTRHLNGDPGDNRLCNLQYGTQSENLNDVVRHGHHWQVNKTCCPQGHAYTPENTVIKKHGRECRACLAARGKARYQAMRAAASHS